MDTLIDLHRFRKETDELSEKLAAEPPKPGGILLYGSSTMANWRKNDMCYHQLSPFPIYNTGFGGATAEETLYFYHSLLNPVKPRLIIYYAGANDMKHNYQTSDVIATMHRLFEWARQDFPGIKFLIIPIKHCPAFREKVEVINQNNKMFCEYAAKHDDTNIIDLHSFIFNSDGNYHYDIYVEDQIHHNEYGYKKLAKTISPYLEKHYKT